MERKFRTKIRHQVAWSRSCHRDDTRWPKLRRDLSGLFCRTRSSECRDSRTCPPWGSCPSERGSSQQIALPCAEKIHPEMKNKTCEHFVIFQLRNGCPGLVDMGGDSCSKCRGFESQCCILDGHFFTVGRSVLVVWKDGNKWKRGGDGHLKKEMVPWMGDDNG